MFLLLMKFIASIADSFGNMCALALFYKLIDHRNCFFLISEHPMQQLSAIRMANAE